MGRIEELGISIINRAITLHPNKRPEYQYKLHNKFQSLRLDDLNERVLALYRESNHISGLLQQPPTGLALTLGRQPSLTSYRPRHVHDVLVWEFFTRRKMYGYSSKSGQPARGVSRLMREAIDSAMQKAICVVVLKASCWLVVVEKINSGSARSRRTVKYNDLKYGYWRVSPLVGLQYVLQSFLTLREYHHGRRTLTVRKHVVVQQSFQSVQFTEDDSEQQSSFTGDNLNGERTSHDDTVHIIVPLTGRTASFERFMENYEKVCLQTNENAKLLIILFKNSNEVENESEQVKKRTSTYQLKYPKAYLKLITVDREFSRGFALDIGASQFTDNSLLFFCDVDIVFKQDVLQRCRSRSIAGEQVYYPVMFSQYDPRFAYGDQSNTSNDSGYWRHSSYGMICLFGEDFSRSGKFNTTIRGWGLEDVDLCNKLVASGINIFRATDPGLVHVYHPIHCDPLLPEKQYKMCLGSKANTYGSTAKLVKRWFDIQPMGLK
uniref:Hexosyltransferase n=1 Tax=Branchiostoma floridae TaxID=7739 RepID=C3Z423_BRAFL|eukprot:XP_002596624.1 hypothetical protein BRAFLDRAFT_78480 [Branchiostoma floridae]